MIADNIGEDAISLTDENRERSEVLANILCEEIIKGQLKPGEKLSETALASRFNLSRGPVREALRRLSERDFVVFSPNAGARVMSNSITDLLDLLEVRESLEVTAARLAAERMTTEEKVRLHDLYETHASVYSNKRQHSYFQSPDDFDFHYAIAKGVKNPILFKILCEDLYLKLLFCRSQHQYIKGRGNEALQEHRLIMTAIEKGDSELAELYMKRHIRAARRSLEASL